MCQKKKKEENHKTVKKGLQRQMIMDGVERKRLKLFCVVENTELQKKLRECDEIKGNEKRCSSMSKTRSKQGRDEWGNCSNVSKTIFKQSIEEILGYFDNGTMGVSSPMSKNRSKQGRDCSNVSKTI